MSKKAALSIQFNWIFILIAGGMILFFFFGIISRQREASDESIDRAMLDYFENILSGTNVKIGTVENYTLGRSSLELSSDFYGFQRSQRDIRNKIVFGPNLVKGNRMIIYTDYWSLPYKIDYFVYITSNEVRYIFVEEDHNTAEIRRIIAIMPDFVNIETIRDFRLSGISDNNHYKVKFIFVNSNLNIQNLDFSQSGIVRRDFSAVNVIVSSGIDIDNFGQVQFYKKERTTLREEGTRMPFLKKETLRGAIFAEDSEFYSKSLQKALNKLDMMSEIYRHNALELEGYAQGNVLLRSYGCLTIYGEILDSIGKIIQNNKELNLHNFENLYNENKKIEDSNKRLMLASCPILF